MGEFKKELILTEEEIEILKSILLERSTFYTKKIVDYKMMQLKSEDEFLANNFQNSIDYNFKLKDTLDKVYKLLK